MLGKSRTMESPPGLKQTLQRMAVATQYPPFLWCYRLLYALAVRLCTRRLRRIRGVSAIYLRRGLAGGKPVYGLSDIDLLVMVEGELSGKTAARVRHQYDLLRRIVPVLPEPAELEIYNREHFRLLYEYSPFYRGRFDQGRRDWQRLHGEDIFTALPPPGDDARRNAWQELRPAWNHLVRELVPDTGSRKSARSLFVRRYVAYKAIAEAARASLVAQGGNLSISRDLALLRAASAVPEQAGFFKEARRLRKNLLEPKPPRLDELLYIFQSLANRTMVATPESAPVTKKLRILAASDRSDESLLSGADISVIDNACAELEGIERAVLVPRLAFDALPTLDLDPIELAGATTDAWDLGLIVRTPPAARALQRFNAALIRLHPLVTAYFCDGEMAFSTRPTKGWAIKVRRAAPEFFSCLSSAKPLSGRLEMADGIEVERPLERENALELRARTLLELFSRPEAFRLPVHSFFTLFWEAGRAACLANQAREPLIEVPVSSAQIVEMLAKYTPSEGAILRMIHTEYWKEGHAHPSESHRFMHWAGRYALMLHERLFSPGSAAMQLPAQARTELTISVTIVTRNRAPLLRKALQSLVEQERAPDQVVIVDNASTDDTAEVARSFQDRLKMTLITERQVGIPIARNTSLKHCSGDIVALLDDDCIADRRWLAEIEEPFLRDPHIAAVGGKLVPVEGRRELVARFYDSRMRDAANGGAQPG